MPKINIKINDSDKFVKNIYFIGIGGVSMSGLALILKKNGFDISGSDPSDSKIIHKLIDENIIVNKNQVESNINSNIDLVVYTAAIKESNPELIASKKLNIPQIDRAGLLGQIMGNYKCPIGISGTHGKSSTTSMVSEIFLEANYDPTITVGGNLKSINGNLKIGSDDYFIFESCEYFNSFLNFFPHTAAILNVELDHVDYFNNIHELRNSFNKFSKNINNDGFLVINNNIEHLEDILKGVKCNVVTFGNLNSILYADNIVYDNLGLGNFDVIYKGENLGKVSLSVVGEHNIMNALAAIGVALIHNVDFNVIKSSLNKFKGIDRRFQVLGKYNNISVVDDYAHHPTEIKCTLEACKNIGNSKIWAVFQPHTYSRTIELLNDFSQAFDDADNVIIVDIYAARETHREDIHSKDIVELLKKQGKNAFYIESFDKAEDFLIDSVPAGDIIITMGAGDVYKIGQNILSKQGVVNETKN